MRILISGGCKNGKSTYAQELAKQQKSGPLYYIATMVPVDDEDADRIKRHCQERVGMGFTTIEMPRAIESILNICDHNGSFLLDSLTALLANEMFSPCSDYDNNACERVSEGLTQILHQIPKIVIVSDYIYGGASQYDLLTETYRKSLAHLDRLVAHCCDMVLEATYTQIITHKGSVPHAVF